MNIPRLCVYFITMFASLPLAIGLATANQTQNWRFTVFLDDTKIGYHHFERVPSAKNHTIRSNAKFDVKFLFINAYSYEHSNSELWNGDCLARINAYTNDNGEQYTVNGTLSGQDNFVIETQGRREQLDGCVKTFAYWDTSILNADRLLNAQTGEYVDINVTPLGTQIIKVNNKQISANVYRLQGEQLQIDLWYSTDNRWLALESVTEGGRRIRYQIQ